MLAAVQKLLLAASGSKSNTQFAIRAVQHVQRCWMSSTSANTAKQPQQPDFQSLVSSTTSSSRVHLTGRLVALFRL